jgi:cysteine synthase A
VVEGTAGNTGIGLARRRQRARLPHADRDPGNPEPGKEGHAAAVRRRAGRGAGAALQQSEQLPARRRRLADQLRKTEPNGVLFADQWNNLDNRKAHYVSTGPEIWQQTGGKVDGFICSVGTGGTLAGTSDLPARKEEGHRDRLSPIRGRRDVQLFRKHGEAKATPGGSITEGIGLGRVTPIIEDIKVDKAYLIPDEEAVPIIFDLLEHEGLCLGGSTGINVAGAIRLAKQLGPGQTIVTVLCDSGTRYQSKLFNPEFMRSKNLPVPAWLEKRSKIDVPFEKV